MRTVVIYKSKSGFTERYGEWIAGELGCDAMEAKNVSEKVIGKYDIVVYGGGIYAGQISGLKKMKKMMLQMRDKKFIVFATGATPAAVTDKINEILRANFTEEEQKNSPFYYFQSGLDYSKMSLPGRLLMKAFSAALEKQGDKSRMESDMSVSSKESYDISDRKFIEPLIRYVNSL